MVEGGEQRKEKGKARLLPLFKVTQLNESSFEIGSNHW